MRGPKPKDYTGVRSGRLVAIAPTGRKKEGRGYIWKIQCDCGKVIEDLPTRFGNIKSCGCLKKEQIKENGSKLHIYDQEYRQKTPGTDIRQLKIKEPNANNKAGYRGVCITRNGYYKAKIQFMGTMYYLGTYDTAAEANAAYTAAKKILHQSYIDRYENNKGSIL